MLRTIPDIQDLLLPLEIAIQQHFIPALTGLPLCSTVVRDLLAFPARHGGLGIVNLTTLSSPYYSASEIITRPLVSFIVSQEAHPAMDSETIEATKKVVRTMNRTRHAQQASNVKDQLPEDMKRHAEVVSEKGASSWLAVLPIGEHGFHLHKGEFRDALRLRYNWQLDNTPKTCNCGAQFSVDHAMICHMGGFLTIRHNEIRDITASLLTETYYNAATEPPLQPLNGETLSARSANTDDNARVDIRARGFWNNHQDAVFDVRVFYPNAPSNCSTDAYRRHEMAKKREYGQRVCEVEHGVFTPLVLSTNGGMGKEAATFYRRLADLIAQKRQHPYSRVMGWLRCRLSFASI